MVSPSFFFRVPEKTPRTVWRCHPVALATSSTVAPLGSTQHGNDLILFRRPFCVGLRFRVWQGLDGRPQPIDQGPAVADLLPLFDTGQSIPQCQQPLAAERSGVQFLLGRDGNLAVSD